MVVQRNSEAKKAISLGIVSILVIAIILIVGFAVYLNPSFNTTSNTTTISSTSTSSSNSSSLLTPTTTTASIVFANYPLSAEATNSTLGLELILSVNQTLILSGQVINVSVSIFNTLSTVNNVTGASDWAISSIHSSASFPCSNYVYYQVYQGHYSEANISSANSPLQVSPVYQYLSCPVFQRSYYLFQPLSDNASIPVGYYTTNSSTLYQNTEMTESGMLIGNYSTSYNSAVFTTNGALPPPPFPTGTFTLAAGDEWGQLAILHFTVGFGNLCLSCITTSSKITSQSPSTTTTNDTIITSGETCTPMNTGNQTSVTYLCHTESARSSNSSS